MARWIVFIDFPWLAKHKRKRTVNRKTYLALDANKTAILSKWLDILQNDEELGLWKDHLAMGMEELETSSRNFLNLFLSLVGQGDINGYPMDKFDPIVQSLKDLSVRRTDLGLTPSATASYIFSLKQVLAEYIQETYRDDAAASNREVLAVNRLIDYLGLKTFEAYTDFIVRQKKIVDALNLELEKQVAEVRKLQAEQEKILIQQAKMAAMGEMLGAIAHNWRQPLNAIGLTVQDLGSAYEFGELDQAYLQSSIGTVMEQVTYMSQTIDDFRNFFQPGETDETFDIKKTVHETFELLRSQLRTSSIDSLCRCQEGIMILGNKNRFKQALVNMVINAKDAVEECRERGEMTEDPQGRITAKTTLEGENVVFTLTDNGGGAPSEVLERMGEYYFTTKERGTGIGLYMTRLIVEQNMKGSMNFRNKGKGMEIEIRIPRADPTASR